MKVKVVTGYVELPVLNCSPSRFRELGHKLVAVAEDVAPTRVFYNYLDECWMFKWLRSSGCPVRPQWPELPTDRFAKPYDAVCSNIVMHQKYEWLALAAIEDPLPDVFIWIDFGVLKQQDMTPQVVTDFLRKVAAKDRISKIEAPGIRQMEPVDDSVSWDRFCGSVVIVPRGHLFPLCQEMKLVAMNRIRETGVITIESNTLAHVELAHPSLFRWYPAWWGASMFTSY
jgi:hypothetical protein